MFETVTEYWWNSTQQLLEAGCNLINYVFKAAFFKKYFSMTVQNIKELEFLSLKQGNMSISEYIVKLRSCQSSLPISRGILTRLKSV